MTPLGWLLTTTVIPVLGLLTAWSIARTFGARKSDPVITDRIPLDAEEIAHRIGDALATTHWRRAVGYTDDADDLAVTVTPVFSSGGWRIEVRRGGVVRSRDALQRDQVWVDVVRLVVLVRGVH